MFTWHRTNGMTFLQISQRRYFPDTHPLVGVGTKDTRVAAMARALALALAAVAISHTAMRLRLVVWRRRLGRGAAGGGQLKVVRKALGN